MVDTANVVKTTLARGYAGSLSGDTLFKETHGQELADTEGNDR
jgi:hypothetical protein